MVDIAGDWAACKRHSVQAGHRACLFLYGPAEEQAALLRKLVPAPPPESRALRLGNTLPLPWLVATPVTPGGEYRKWLGQTLDWLLIDGFSGLNVNAFAALSGCLRGGGQLIVCLPHPDDSRFADPECERLFTYPYGSRDSRQVYHHWLAAKLKASPPGLVIGFSESGWERPGAVVSPAPATRSNSGGLARTDPEGKIQPTDEQCRIIDAVRAMAESPSPATLLIASDRGRGKSVSLGMALKALPPESWDLTSHHPHAISTLCQLAASTRPFTPSEELIARPNPDRLLVIDEASALPPAVLQALLERYSRCVLATTLQGYEGSGQGFRLRFLPQLQQSRSGLQHLTLTQPIRWCDGDPLERFVDDTLLLQGTQAPSIQPVSEPPMEKISIEVLAPEKLVQAEQLLVQTSQLLALAHYRTEPDDLRRLLDSPSILALGALVEGQLLGTVVISQESSIQDTDLRQAIIAGKRRPRGLLTPLTLCQQAGHTQALSINTWRILRIVVQPQYQRLGIGTALMKEVLALATRHQQDLLSTSFALYPEVAQFWKTLGFTLLRAGLKADQTSGAPGMLAGKALSPEGQRLTLEAEARVRERLAFDCRRYYDGLSDAQLEALLGLRQRLTTPPPSHALISRFAKEEIPYESVEDLLPDWAAHHLDLQALEQTEKAVWIRKVLRQRPWSDLREAPFHLGKGPACQVLRDSFNNFTIGNN